MLVTCNFSKHFLIRRKKACFNSKVIISHIWGKCAFVHQGNSLVLCDSGFWDDSYLAELTHDFV